MEEVVSGWHYDRILTQRKGEIQIAHAEQARIKGIIKEELQKYKRVEFAKAWSKHGLTENDIKTNMDLHARTLRKDYTDGAIKAYGLTQKAHPILIGPATLDSLLESEPDRLDYITEGKFPFDDVFFEFMEPVDHPLPGYNLPAKLCGVQLNKMAVRSIAEKKGYVYERLANKFGREIDSSAEENPVYVYVLGTHFNLDDGTYAEFTTPVIQKSQQHLDAYVRLPSHKEMLTIKRKVEEIGEYAHLGDFSSCERDKDMPPHSSYYFGNEKHNFDFPLNAVDLGDITSQVGKFNRLAINLINFVNAQNVTLIPHKRKVQTRLNRPGARPITHEANAPYHIIGIDTRTIHIDEERDSSCSLAWRVYVRGHNRHYRDDQDQIRMVTWIAPHVKGPEDAPWRHHRYALLAEMLQRERDKLGEYVPRIIRPSETSGEIRSE